jgi:hypothetical protein
VARPQTFARDLKVATAGLEPEAISALLAKTARAALAKAQAAGEAPANYVRSVNGRIGAAEESVVPPGPIVYSFQWWPEIVTYALAFAEARSPVLSGRFKASWFVLVNGSQVTDFDEILFDAEVILTNDQPYARKLEIGRIRARVPPGIVEDTVSAVRRRFGDIISAQRKFINLAGAYRLKTSSGRRRDRQVGRVISYPAAVMTMRF